MYIFIYIFEIWFKNNLSLIVYLNIMFICPDHIYIYINAYHLNRFKFCRALKLKSIKASRINCVCIVVQIVIDVLNCQQFKNLNELKALPIITIR